MSSHVELSSIRTECVDNDHKIAGLQLPTETQTGMDPEDAAFPGIAAWATDN